ncbi:hypothetical protein B0I35DRAFT_477624 [Stachybotrys elegans]|uniref:Uncharacterized protein n=1 Tax=Stachybotrys elegans TaxID=80388 RepID=A0A8K0SUT3_9HYPO|nr:hypothetical protein B0I35DRAFT_477624 [Stachybotrys elegans]
MSFTSSLHGRHSSTSSSPPAVHQNNTEDMELDVLTPATSISDSLPEYRSTIDFPPTAFCSSSSSSSTAAGASFCPTRTFQIETPGIGLIRLPVPPRADPIYVYSLTPGSDALEPVYVSLRDARCSGNSILARADDAECAPLCTTTYRFGPNRPPQIRLYASATVGDEEFAVLSRGISTRAQIMRTPLGTFTWRFASRHERREEAAHSLLIMERITTVALEGGKKREIPRRVAHLIRNDEVRAVGSSKSSAGNGGRLVMDLREWADTKGEAEQMEVLVVASCLVMLKKEIDRRRMLQAMVIAS